MQCSQYFLELKPLPAETFKMSDQQKHNLIWWLKTVGQAAGTVLVAYAPEILQLFPEQTLLFKLALPIGFMLKLMFLRKDYKADGLPDGLSKVMDKIPNKITGIKGSK